VSIAVWQRRKQLQNSGHWRGSGHSTAKSPTLRIDVFEDQGKLYLIWSGWEGDTNGTQNIYIARMKNPWTVESARLRVSTPEKVGDVDQKKTRRIRLTLMSMRDRRFSNTTTRSS
jgi:GH43 family beta-xylosidase